MSHPTPPHARRLLPQHCSRRVDRHIPTPAAPGTVTACPRFGCFFCFVFPYRYSRKRPVLSCSCCWLAAGGVVAGEPRPGCCCQRMPQPRGEIEHVDHSPSVEITMRPTKTGDKPNSAPHITAGPARKLPVQESATTSVRQNWRSFGLLAFGVFVFYVIHDAIQERLFRTPGFEFGSFMTVAELTAMAVGSTLSRCTRNSASSSAAAKPTSLLPSLPVLALNLALVVLIAMSQTSGSQVCDSPPSPPLLVLLANCVFLLTHVLLCASRP